ncbi:CMP-N-acetylneuraminate-beta-galactosamide-alpha-2,3-sialyltransferase 2 isoform X2 [Alexandromys fortis]|uniref:CMP-N-acetylneuraminate-beta-galactosamide- alpha-2,3-sialyltransferase 2 isoform X2 n=1 Tax=Alexandromys fortis TaxID=100897 RepID=UPI0021532199|nr:CMP-N-acetylneuraminate-beta-galactosamide-alpha-2,3-sialyltransferase 2 isoform X2 [Microtus fortis]
MGRGHPPPSPTLPFCWAGVGGGAGPRLQPRRSGRAGPSKGGTGPKQANWRALKLTGPGAGGGGGDGSFLHGRRRRQERQAWPARRPAQTEMLQPQFKSHNTNEVLEKLFQIVPGENPYRFRDPQQCRRCAVVGNSGNLRGSGYGQDVDGHNFIMRMNQAPTVGFEKDVGSRTTHHFMYPESAKNLPANVSFVLVPFKALDLMWIASALSTGQIRFTYAPVKSFLRVDKEKVQIYNPAFFKYIHDRWTEHHGRYPSTGMLVLFFALHVCDEVNVYGFGADSRGNWHHYWENNRYAGEFRKTGVHDADFEAHIIDMLAKASKIEVYRGN